MSIQEDGDAPVLADRLAAVEALHRPVPDPEDRPGVVWCSCAGGSEERPYYEYADCPTVRALGDPTGTLAKVKADALREAAHRWTHPNGAVERTLQTDRYVPDWLRDYADRIEAEAADS
jgi:hypothetical protein